MITLAFAARSEGYFEIAEGPDFPEVGLITVTVGLLPWLVSRLEVSLLTFLFLLLGVFGSTGLLNVDRGV